MAGFGNMMWPYRNNYTQLRACKKNVNELYVLKAGREPLLVITLNQRYSMW